MIKIKEYFKGYYFKCSNTKETISFIPAIHFNGKEKNASLQIITADAAYTVPYDNAIIDDKNFRTKIGDNYFSTKGIKINIKNENLSIFGNISFGPFEKIRYDIMGPFQYVPHMQCRHTVVSMSHYVNGMISINGKTYHFKKGIGYIEGDSGYSFPKEYAWTHCHYENSSIMLSVADIPISRFHFQGVIAIIMIEGKEYRIATYLGAKIKYTKNNTIVVKQGKYTLTAKLIKSNSHMLNAPHNGEMLRTIRESASCTACYKFTFEDKTLIEFTSDMASFEYEYKQ